MNTNNATNMHMTAEVWNALVEMMDVNQLINIALEAKGGEA